MEPNNRSWRRRLDDRRSLRSARHSDLNPCPLNTTSLRSRTSSDDATRCRYILQAIRYLHRTGFFFPSPAGTLSNLPSTNTTFTPLTEPSSGELVDCKAIASIYAASKHVYVFFQIKFFLAISKLHLLIC